MVVLTMLTMRHLRLRDITGCIDHELLEHGRPGHGVVTDVEIERTVRAASVDYHVCRLTVRLLVDGEPPYTTVVHQRIPVAALLALTDGAATVPVRVDPADPRTVALDLAAIA
jgi:hypothetical protein